MTSANTLKVTVLLAGLTGLFVLIGGALGGTSGMIIALVFAVGLNMAMWWFSGKLALKLSRARAVTPEEQPGLYAAVTRLAERAEIPTPRVYMIDSPMPNAFATGRSPAHGAIAVTTGLMSLLDEREIDGVIAHELAHIKHRDTLIASIAASIAGAISMVADMFFWSMLFGGSQDEEGAGAGGFLMIFIAPIIALILQLAISRSREFSADEAGARIAGDPMPLASALQKLEATLHSKQPHEPEARHVNPATAPLYIVSPLAGGGMLALLRTHPPTEQRVARLMALRDSMTSERLDQGMPALA
ncbi:MAG TPA: zinc metalloprotease HtpX [Candidatus Limnocylindrales bacterium]|nr:zinc metalloprotease HtpX [Candidatus Limnocylindrales bacterium]